MGRQERLKHPSGRAGGRDKLRDAARGSGFLKDVAEVG